MHLKMLLQRVFLPKQNKKSISELLSEVFKELAPFAKSLTEETTRGEIFHKSDPLYQQTQSRSHRGIMGTGAKSLCQEEGQVGSQNQKHTGGYFLNRLHSVSKSAPRTSIKTLHFLRNPIKIRRARAPVPSRHTTYMYPSDKLTADLLCSICQVQNSRFTPIPHTLQDSSDYIWQQRSRPYCFSLKLAYNLPSSHMRITKSQKAREELASSLM